MTSASSSSKATVGFVSAAMVLSKYKSRQV
jgi:hypothetical protein